MKEIVDLYGEIGRLFDRVSSYLVRAEDEQIKGFILGKLLTISDLIKINTDYYVKLQSVKEVNDSMRDFIGVDVFDSDLKNSPGFAVHTFCEVHFNTVKKTLELLEEKMRIDTSDDRQFSFEFTDS